MTETETEMNDLLCAAVIKNGWLLFALYTKNVVMQQNENESFQANLILFCW